MRSIDPQDFIPIGYLAKPHGLSGDVLIETDEDFEDLLSETDHLMVEVEGGLVPFFITEDGIDFRTPTSCVVAFDELDSADKVRPYCGCRVFLPRESGRELPSESDLNGLIGFTAFDQEKGELGKITRIDDFSGNIVLTVLHRRHEVLIPLSEELIIRMDQNKQELHLDCPEGLIELYLGG